MAAPVGQALARSKTRRHGSVMAHHTTLQPSHCMLYSSLTGLDATLGPWLQKLAHNGNRHLEQPERSSAAHNLRLPSVHRSPRCRPHNPRCRRPQASNAKVGTEGIANTSSARLAVDDPSICYPMAHFPLIPKHRSGQRCSRMSRGLQCTYRFG
jgi:hypothetical protein